MIFRQVEDRNDRARVLCDFNWLGNAEEHALLRDEISQQRWHLHTPGKYGIDPSASEDEWVKAYARRIASHVIDIVRDAGGISR
jgi:hypothetical protein